MIFEQFGRADIAEQHLKLLLNRETSCILGKLAPVRAASVRNPAPKECAASVNRMAAQAALRGDHARQILGADGGLPHARLGALLAPDAGERTRNCAIG